MGVEEKSATLHRQNACDARQRHSRNRLQSAGPFVGNPKTMPPIGMIVKNT